jgi:hypothetical protein
VSKARRYATRRFHRDEHESGETVLAEEGKKGNVWCGFGVGKATAR